MFAILKQFKCKLLGKQESHAMQINIAAIELFNQILDIASARIFLIDALKLTFDHDNKVC